VDRKEGRIVRYPIQCDAVGQCILKLQWGCRTIKIYTELTGIDATTARTGHLYDSIGTEDWEWCPMGRKPRWMGYTMLERI